VRLLLSFGADPNQRGINDYTPLHMAVAERNTFAVQMLLEHGANPALRTRIDDYHTAEEMALTAGLNDIAAILARKGRDDPRRLRSGRMLLSDIPGDGESVRRQHHYRIRLRLWLKSGQTVRWQSAWGPTSAARLDDNGETLITAVQINRGSLINGLFYGVEGMCIRGMRRLEIAPELGYGHRGIPGIIPAGATLIAEITILEAVKQPDATSFR
jgi:hypothetical protein